VTEGGADGFFSGTKICNSAAKVQLADMGVRIVGQMLNDAFGVMQTRTAALNTSVRADSAGRGSCF
jgi:hypothetical protein